MPERRPRIAPRWALLGLLAGCVAPGAQGQASLGIGPTQNAGAYRKLLDRNLSFVCPASDGTTAAVYGTDVYTDDSAICAAAIHAGVLAPNRAGIVTIRMGEGAKSFRASERNGVISREYGAWPHSYTFVQEGETSIIAWSTIWKGVPAAFEGPVVVACPSGGDTRAAVWGTERYTPDSAICVAAVHAGYIVAAQGGTIAVQRTAGTKDFQASERHGVASRHWGAMEDAFTVSAATGEAPPEPPPADPPDEEQPPRTGAPAVRTIVLPAIAGVGGASQPGAIMPRTIALTGVTGVGPMPASGPIGPRTLQPPGWTGVGPAP